MTNHDTTTSPAATDSMAPHRRTVRLNWCGPIVLVAATAVGVAGLAGVRAMPADHGSPNVAHVETTAARDPLIVPEEQAFIDAQLDGVPVVATPVIRAARDPLIVPEEQAFIDAHLDGVPVVATPAVRAGTDPWCAHHRSC